MSGELQRGNIACWKLGVPEDAETTVIVSSALWVTLSLKGG